MPASRASPFLGKSSAALVFQDDTIILGESAGADGECIGELVFTTSMTGFQESLTDPSYAGQILTFAYPLIGNYGVSESAFESLENKVWANGVVVREACSAPVHYEAKTAVSGFLKEQGIPAVAGVDTRAIVLKVREHGVLPAGLLTWKGEIGGKDFQAMREALQGKIRKFNYSSVNFVEITSEKRRKVFRAKREKHNIALMDYGAKASIVRSLVARDCTVTVFPHDTKADAILAEDFDGIMLSNGPGDPSFLKNEIMELRKLAVKKPVFGICLGHQLLASAFGAKTFKLKFGHRGANHSVQDVESGRAFVTSQNHGFAVDAKTLPRECKETLVNCLDGTNEGIKHKELPVFSIQFHAEANPGPYDASAYFEEFLGLLK